MKTRITELLGIEHPIFQAAMSWASSNAPLVIAVSNAVLAADVRDSCLVGPASLPIRRLKNAFTRKFDAASEGDLEWGKVEAGQSAGLVDDIVLPLNG